jgi:hypothetical protein
MKPPPDLSVIADRFLTSIKAQGKARRLLSSTFWGTFGYKARTKERVAAVRRAFDERGIRILSPAAEEFGTEPFTEWIRLGLEVPAGHTSYPRPKDEWFADVARRQFESECEVDSFFVIPVLQELGYGLDDIAQGCPVQITEGSQHRLAEADFALFDGGNRDQNAALLVIESKRFGKPLPQNAHRQAQSYAIWLCAPYYVVTNGDDIDVYENLGAPQKPVEVMRLKREELRTRWGDLAAKLNKKAVVVRKAQIAETLKQARSATL